MSVALERIMAQSMAPNSPGQDTGTLAFLLIAVAGVMGFVALTTLLVGQVSGFEHWVICSVSYVAVMLPVYILHRRFSYRTRDALREALPRYVAVQAMALLLVGLFGFITFEVISTPGVLAAILVISLAAAVNCVAIKLWASARRKAAIPAVA